MKAGFSLLFFFLFFIIIATTQAQNLTSGVIASYTFDNINTTHVIDDSPNNNHLEITGTNNNVTGFIGGAQQLNISGTEYAHFGTPLGTAWTVCMWVQPTSVINVANIFSTTNDTSETAIYFYPISTAPVALEDYQNAFYTETYQQGFSEQFNAIAQNDTYMIGIYQHYCVAFNGNTETIQIYRNGTLTTTTISDLPDGAYDGTLDMSSYAFYLGADESGGTLNRAEGNYDELLIYNRTLNTTETQELYENYAIQGISYPFITLPPAPTPPPTTDFTAAEAHSFDLSINLFGISVLLLLVASILRKEGMDTMFKYTLGLIGIIMTIAIINIII